MKKLMKLELKILQTTLFLVLLSCDAWAGTTLQDLSSAIKIINVDEKKRADDALEKAKKDASSAVHPYVHDLESLQKAVYEKRAFRTEILFYLRRNKKQQVLTDWEVFRMKQLAEQGQYQEFVNFSGETITKYGAMVFCGSEEINSNIH